jgi:hypothetical protein
MDGWMDGWIDRLSDKPLYGEANTYKVFVHFICKADICRLICTICISNPTSKAVTTDLSHYMALSNSLEKQDGRVWTAFTGVNFGGSGGCCEHG